MLWQGYTLSVHDARCNPKNDPVIMPVQASHMGTADQAPQMGSTSP